MSNQILEDIIKESLSGTMNIRSIQLAVSQIANFLLQKSQTEITSQHGHGLAQKNNSQISFLTLETEKLRENKNTQKQLLIVQQIKQDIGKLQSEMKEIFIELKIQIQNQFTNYLGDFTRKFVGLQEKFKIQAQIMAQKTMKILDDVSALRNCLETIPKEDQSVNKPICQLEIPLLNLQKCKEYGNNKIVSKDWVYKNSYRFSCLQFIENRIYTKGWANVLGASYLPQIFQFEVMFEQISFGVQVGISDVENARKQNFQTNYISLASNRELWVDGKICKKFHDFFQGSVLTVFGNFKQAKIEIQINGQTVFIYEYEKMKCRDIKWVPYIFLARNSIVHLLK